MNLITADDRRFTWSEEAGGYVGAESSRMRRSSTGTQWSPSRRRKSGRRQSRPVALPS